MTEDANREENALEEEARRRALEISASEDATARRQAEEEVLPSPDEEIADVRRSGCQHDISDVAAYQRPCRERRRGPRR